MSEKKYFYLTFRQKQTKGALNTNVMFRITHKRLVWKIYIESIQILKLLSAFYIKFPDKLLVCYLEINKLKFYSELKHLLVIGE